MIAQHSSAIRKVASWVTTTANTAHASVQLPEATQTITHNFCITVSDGALRNTNTRSQ